MFPNVYEKGMGVIDNVVVNISFIVVSVWLFTCCWVRPLFFCLKIRIVCMAQKRVNPNSNINSNSLSYPNAKQRFFAPPPVASKAIAQIMTY